MNRTAGVLVSLLAAALAATGLGAGVAHAGIDATRAKKVPTVTVPVILSLTGDDATIDPIPGTDRFRLRVQGTDNELVWFTDHPARRMGHMKADDLAGEWSRVFGKNPPMTALMLRKDGQAFTYVVETTCMAYDNGVLALSIEPMTAAMGALPSKADEVTVIIDEGGARVPRDPADHPLVPLAKDVREGEEEPLDVPVPNEDWVFHSIVQPSDDTKYVGPSTVTTDPSDTLVYSMPAAYLVSNFSYHHLDQGWGLRGAPAG